MSLFYHGDTQWCWHKSPGVKLPAPDQGPDSAPQCWHLHIKHCHTHVVFLKRSVSLKNALDEVMRQFHSCPHLTAHGDTRTGGTAVLWEKFLCICLAGGLSQTLAHGTPRTWKWWLFRLRYVADVFSMNEESLSIQGKQLIVVVANKIQAFKQKLEPWKTYICRQELHSFPST